MRSNRLLIKVDKEYLPQIKDRYPFLYLERGRLEVDDSSVKWVGANRDIYAIPVATIATILLGPGTTVTHEAVKAISSSNTTICWVGDDSLRFYASGMTPTADTRNLLRQIRFATDPETRLTVAKRLFSERFPNESLDGKSLQTLMGMEGVRVRALYASKAEEYGVPWNGRRYIPGKIEVSDKVNRYLTHANSLLYAVITSSVIAHGYDPRIGFIHSGSPLPFIYDLSDLYKEILTIDLAFMLASKEEKRTNARLVEEFTKRAVDFNLLSKLSQDLEEIFKDLGC